jgi:hypothetical protein
MLVVLLLLVVLIGCSKSLPTSVDDLEPRQVYIRLTGALVEEAWGTATHSDRDIGLGWRITPRYYPPPKKGADY